MRSYFVNIGVDGQNQYNFLFYFFFPSGAHELENRKSKDEVENNKITVLDRRSTIDFEKNKPQG